MGFLIKNNLSTLFLMIFRSSFRKYKFLALNFDAKAFSLLNNGELYNNCLFLAVNNGISTKEEAKQQRKERGGRTRTGAD